MLTPGVQSATNLQERVLPLVTSLGSSGRPDAGARHHANRDSMHVAFLYSEYLELATLARRPA